MTDLVTRDMNLMYNTGVFELHGKISQFFIILMSYIELSAALLPKVEANILLEIKSISDNKKPIFHHWVKVQALKSCSFKLIECISSCISIQHPGIIKEVKFSPFFLTLLFCVEFSDASVDWYENVCALCHWVVFFFIFAFILSFFFFAQYRDSPNSYFLQFRVLVTPFVARFCSVSIAGTWTLLEWRIAVAEQGRAERKKRERGYTCHSLVLFPFSCATLLRSVHKSF